MFDFVNGCEDQWRDFDLGDEVDLRPAYLEDEPGPARWVPADPPKEAPMPDQKLTIGIFRTATGDVPPARRGLGALKDALRRAGAAYDCCKFGEADTWAGLYDPTGMTPQNAGSAAAQVAFLADNQGGRAAPVGEIPWVVPRGFDVLAEARFHGYLCREHATAKSLIVDWEWKYAGFWAYALNGAPLPLPRRVVFGAGGPVYGPGSCADWQEAAEAYWRCLRYFAGPESVLIICPDPRQLRDDVDDANGTRDPAYELAPLLSAGSVTAVMPQTYWTDFKMPWHDCYRDLIEGTDYCGAAVYPMVPGDARTTDIAAALDYLVSRGYTSIGVYQIAGLYDADLDVLAQYARPLAAPAAVADAPAPPAPTPPVVPASVWEERVNGPIYAGITAGRALSDAPDDRADCDAISRKMDEMKARHVA